MHITSNIITTKIAFMAISVYYALIPLTIVLEYFSYLVFHNYQLSSTPNSLSSILLTLLYPK